MLCWVCSSTLPFQVVKYSDVCLVSFNSFFVASPSTWPVRACVRHVYWILGFVKKLVKPITAFDACLGASQSIYAFGNC